MNVYDFDKTIYDGDSTIDFWKFCLKRYPLAIVALFPTICGIGLYMIGKTSKVKLKQRFYTFLKYIPDIDCQLSAFWEKNEIKIQNWYVKQKRDDDLIISASPYFLLKPICDDLGVRLIASKVEKNTGICAGENCYGQEKVRRLQSEVPDANINAFYSDSLSDKPLADLAKRAYLVHGTKITEWKGNHNA